MADVVKRTLGQTGLAATTMGYGAMELRGTAGGRGREVTPQMAKEILNAVLDSGINFIDTSIDYGQSEELIGESIAHRRSEFFLASKCGCLAMQVPPELADRVAEWRGPHLYTRENIIAGVEQSLRRMKTDYLDLVQVHMSPSREELERNEVPQVLADLKQQGKVRFIGMSGILPDLRDHIAMGAFDTFQIPYSALEREHEDVISEAARMGAGVIVRGGAARGVPSDDRQQGARWDLWRQAGLDGLLEEGMGRMEFILRFTFTHPDLHTNIVGTSNPEHLRENLDALAKGPLSSELYEEAKRRLALVGSVPGVAQPR